MLQELVDIPSETKDIDGVEKVLARMVEELRKAGFSVRAIPNVQKDLPTRKAISGPQVVAEFRGSDPRFVTLVVHADTVFAKSEKFSLSADGLTAKGSGVGDNKGGFVVALLAGEKYISGRAPKFSLRIVISPNEELGSVGLQDELKKLASDSVAVLSLEPARETGAITTARKGVRFYNVETEGLEAHAGADHDKGINACYDLAKKIAQLQELTDYRAGTTVNIGVVTGGKRSNIVCGSASAQIDTRFTNVAAGKKLDEKIRRIAGQTFARAKQSGKTGKTTVTVSVDMPPFDPSSISRVYSDFFRASIKELEGREIEGLLSGGGADLNYMARDGLIMVDGLGPVVRNVHTADETIETKTLSTRAEALSRLLVEIERKVR